MSERRSVGDVLRGHRLEAGITQAELAARSGVAQPRVSDYERDKLTPPTQEREALESALGLRRGQTLIEAGLVDLGGLVDPRGLDLPAAVAELRAARAGLDRLGDALGMAAVSAPRAIAS
jgi:transcriptional regulator with XRE-family HTH domain